MENQHKRRVRYKGTHPRHFHEKYKEQNPEKYAETIEKVISKGSTPAGMHISIMVQEILDVLKIQPGEHGLDATLGYGGHTKAMLEKLCGVQTSDENMTVGGECESDAVNSCSSDVVISCDSTNCDPSGVKEDISYSGSSPVGRIVALDVDPIEIVKTRERLKAAGYGDDVLKIVQTNFRNIDQVAEEHGKFDFVLADLGVSSMQIDTPERGFSYKVDATLDLRLDPKHGVSAAERLNELSEYDFIGLMMENSDEPYAEQIAAVVTLKKKMGMPIKTTFDLKNAIEEGIRRVPKGQLIERDYKEACKKSCARVFQALRIDVNSEFEVLYDFLEKLPEVLNPGARVAILTFHSGEDRLVKKAFKAGYKAGIYSEIADDVIRPSAQECQRNPRAKSTKLRYAVANK